MDMGKRGRQTMNSVEERITDNGKRGQSEMRQALAMTIKQL